MALQESIYSDTTLSDFSTALLRANNKDQKLQFKGDKSMNSLANDHTSPANHNLSSLLSQIQDDGPAYTGSEKPDKIYNRIKNNQTTASTSQQDAGLNSDEVVSMTLKKLQQGESTNADISIVKTNPGIWLLFLLVLCVAVGLVLTVFKLDLRTSELEESLNLYDASVQDSVTSQTQNEHHASNPPNQSLF